MVNRVKCIRCVGLYEFDPKTREWAQVAYDTRGVEGAVEGVCPRCHKECRHDWRNGLTAPEKVRLANRLALRPELYESVTREDNQLGLVLPAERPEPPRVTEAESRRLMQIFCDFTPQKYREQHGIP